MQELRSLASSGTLTTGSCMHENICDTHQVHDVSELTEAASASDKSLV